MNREQIDQAASDLFAAERQRQQIGLLSSRHPGITMADAYAIQQRLVEHKLAAGRVIRGWKIGLTSRAMQQALGIDVPDSGVLFDDMFFDHGAVIPARRFIQTRIEAEIAFVMQSDLAGTAVTREQVLDATAYIVPALEILDTRILRHDPETGVARKIVDTISDNAANAGIVLGTHTAAPRDIDMRWLGAIVKRNGEVEETGLGAGVLDDPATGLVWLVQRLAEYGSGLRAGDVVLSGSFIRPIEARPGDRFVAEFSPTAPHADGAAVDFGQVEVTFAEDG